ncbi:MAG: transcriptional repressor NrdR [Fibrobacteraceae bacterium]|nr:transcriptional repressor NrdR [Fibrobacteraceae bacterium]
MICPFCKNENDKVVDSRVSGTSIRRRRECTACGRRFTTREYIEIQPLTVIKRNGDKEAFQREKLLKGISNSCKKRPVSIDQMEAIATDVENILSSAENTEVSYDQIGNLVMQELKKVDAVAYVRFASVYREFKEVGEFVDQIKTLGDK